MRVRMRVGISGTRNGQPWPGRGEVVDLPESTAKHMVAGGLAVAVDNAEDRETAVEPVTETKKRSTRKSSGLTKRSLDGDAESE